MSNTIHRCFQICLSVFVIILTFVFSAHACRCGEERRVCANYGTAKAVFVGKVIEGQSMGSMSDKIGPQIHDRTFKFVVSRGFLGAQSGETITIRTGFGFGDCGFPFKKGDEYIVYAYEENGQLKTSVCTGTRSIAKAATDIKELDDLLRNAGAQITGRVTRYGRSSLLGEPLLPLANRIVRAASVNSSAVFRTKTDAHGNYGFKSLPGGRYTLEPDVDKGWELDYFEKVEFQLNAHGCATKDISFETDSDVRVTVTDPDGRPVTNTWVEFIPVEVSSPNRPYPEEFSATNPQGQLFMFGLPPGRYTVSINFFNAPNNETPFPGTFAPGVLDRAEARVINIKPGTKIEDVVIRIPHRLESSIVFGKVYWLDGAPAEDAYVGLYDVVSKNGCVNGCVETDKDGIFRVSGFVGRKYEIRARAYKTVGGREAIFRFETEEFTIGDELEPIRLTLRRSKN